MDAKNIDIKNIMSGVKNFFGISYSTTFYVVKRLLVLTEIFLFLRFILKFFDASPQAIIVDVIYDLTNFLVLPFVSIFPDFYVGEGFIVETATISAMIGYVMGIFIIFQLLRLFSRN